MKLRLATLLFLFGLFALSANRARACGSEQVSKSAQSGIEQSCCGQPGDTADSCSDDDGQHPGKQCPCDHQQGGCHCHGCSLMCHPGAVSAGETPVLPEIDLLNDSVRKMAFYFADHLPEAVYLPIWQPPKVSA